MRRRSRYLRQWSARLALCAVVMPATAQSVPLIPKYKLGRTSYVELTTVVRLTDGADWARDDPGELLFSRVTLGVLETVEKASDAGVRLRRTIDRIAVESRTPLLPPMAWDTDGRDPPAGTPALENVLTCLLGRSYTIDMDVEGRPISVSGLDRVCDVLQKQGGALPALASLASVLREAHVRKECSMLVAKAFYPGRRVRVGERWTCDRVEQAGSFGNLRASYSCTLANVGSATGRRVARVECDADFHASTEKPERFDCKRFRVIRGTQHGWAKFDVLSGRYVLMESESCLELGMPTRTDGPGDDVVDPVAMIVRVNRSGFSCNPGRRNRQKRERTHTAQPGATTP